MPVKKLNKSAGSRALKLSGKKSRVELTNADALIKKRIVAENDDDFKLNEINSRNNKAIQSGRARQIAATRDRNRQLKLDKLRERDDKIKKQKEKLQPSQPLTASAGLFAGVEIDEGKFIYSSDDDEVILAKKRSSKVLLHAYETIRVDRDTRDEFTEIKTVVSDDVVVEGSKPKKKSKREKAQDFAGRHLPTLKDLLVTKKGFIRSDADIAQIRKKIRDANRKKKNEARAEELKLQADKKREREKARYDRRTGFNFVGGTAELKVPIKEEPKLMSIAKQHKMEKEANKELRKSFVASRKAKVNRKLAQRRRLKSVTTEAHDFKSESLNAVMSQYDNDVKADAMFYEALAHVVDGVYNEEKKEIWIEDKGETPILCKDKDIVHQQVEDMKAQLDEGGVHKDRSFLNRIANRAINRHNADKIKEKTSGLIQFITGQYDDYGVVVECVHDAVCFAYQITRCRNKWDFYAASAMYLKSYKLGIIPRASIAYILSTIAFIDDVTTEAFDTVRKAINWTQAMIHSSLGKAIRDVILAASTFHMFDKKTAGKIYKYIGAPMKGSMIDILETTFDGLTRIFEVGELVISGVPIDEALFSDDPISAHLKQGEYWRKMSKNLYPGLPVEGKKSQAEFMHETTRIIRFLAKILPTLHGIQQKKVKNELLDLQMCQNDIKVQMAGTRRKAPIGIILHGPPGIGKSNLLAFITRIHCDVMGRRYSDRYMFSRTLTSAFWEGYDPLSHKYIHYSEVGATHSSIASKSGDPIITELTSLIDGTAFSCDMAFAGKGMNYAQPELVVADTNCADLNLTYIVKNPAAYERRFIYVEPTVRGDYVDPYGVALDKKKASKSEDPFNLWTFNVYRCTATSNTASVKIPLLSGGDITALYDTLSGLFKTHEENEQRVLEVITDALTNRVYGSEGFDPKDIDRVNEIDNFTKVKGLNAIGTDVKAKLDCAIKGLSRRVHSRAPLFTSSGFTSTTMSNMTYDTVLSSHESMPDLETVPSSDGCLGLSIDGSIDSTSEADEKLSKEQLDHIDVASRLALSTDGPNALDTWRYGLSKWQEPWIRMQMTYAYLILKKYWMPVMVALFAAMGGIYSTLLGIAVMFLCFELPFANTTSGTVYYAKQAIPSAGTILGWMFYGVSWKAVLLGKIVSWTFSSANVMEAGKKLGSSLVDESSDFARFYVDYAKHLAGRNPTFKPYTSYKRYRMRIALAALVIGGGVAMACRVFMRRRQEKKHTEAHSKFVNEEPMYEDIKVMEDTQFHCAGALHRKSTAKVDEWNMFQSKYVSEINVKDADEFYKRVCRNVRRAVFLVDGIERGINVLGLFGSYAIFNSHALLNKQSGVIKVSKTGILTPEGGYADTIVTKSNSDMWGNDITMVRLSGVNFRDIRKFIAKDDHFPDLCQAIIGGDRTTATLVKHQVTVKDKQCQKVVVNQSYKYAWKNHTSGKCGIPLFCQKDSAYALCGIHFAGQDFGDLGFATLVTQDKVEKSYLRIVESSNFMDLHSEADMGKFTGLEPVVKSPFLHEEFHGLENWGRQEGPILMQKDSKLVKTLYDRGETVRLFTTVFPDYDPKTEFVPPTFRPFIGPDGEYYSAYNQALRKLACDRKPCDPDILEHIIQEVHDRIVDWYKPRGIVWTPMTCEEAINGSADDAFLRRINPSTSGGYGWKGGKARYIPVVDESGKPGVIPMREPTPDLAHKIKTDLETYLAGQACGHVYSAALKDEPRDKDKVAKGKIRVFWMSPLCGLVESRMFLSPFYTAEVENSDLFCTCVGIDMHREAGKLFEELLAFSKKLMEGDYEKFDQGMPFDIGWTACSIIYRVCKTLGFVPAALHVLAGILTDSLFPIGEMNNDIFVSAGQQPSGKYGTAEDNGLRGLILLMYYFYWYKREHKLDHLGSFFQYVLPKTYGDDVLAAVKPEIASWFNGVAYGKFVKEHYGMGFTTASKSANMREFVSPDEMTFLKRKFRYHKDLERVVAPLDMDSILKTLQWRMPSKVVNEETQMLDTLRSVMRELVFHCDEEQFETIRVALLHKYAEHFKVGYDFVEEQVGSYFTFVNSLKQRDLCPSEEAVGGGSQRIDEDPGMSGCSTESQDVNAQQSLKRTRSEDDELGCTLLPLETTKRPATTESIYKRIQALKEERIKLLNILDESKFDGWGSSRQTVERSRSYRDVPAFRKKADAFFLARSRWECVELTLKHLDGVYQERVRMAITTESLDLTTEASDNVSCVTLYETFDKRLYKFLTFLSTFYGLDLDLIYPAVSQTGLNVPIRLMSDLRDMLVLSYLEGPVSLGISLIERQNKAIEKMSFFVSNAIGIPPGIPFPPIVKSLGLTPQINDDLVAYTNSFQPHYELTTEAAEMSGPIAASVEQKIQNFEDMAGTETDDTMIGFTEGSWQLGMAPSVLGDFLRRPVEVTNAQALLNSDFDFSVNPWQWLLNTPSIRAKIKNFAFMRADLKIKIAVSGTQWHYGMLQASYVPYHNVNPMYQRYSTSPPSRLAFLQYLSATPGSQTIDITDNAPLEMTIPYVSTQPMIRLFNNSDTVISASTNFDEATNLGSFELHSLVQPHAISGSTNPVSINVVAWFENVILGCPTATVLEISTEAEELEGFTTEADERRVGPIERFASRATQIMNALTSVPWIAGYAKASSIALGGLTNLAALFGFSYPTIISAPTRMRPDGYQNEANLIGYDTGRRITLDPLQEVSVDPRICSVHEDEMCIAYMCKTPALLSQFTWGTSNAPNSGSIWYGFNCPNISSSYNFDTHKFIQPTPLAFAARPFSFWRGDITYRLQVVCSKFHKGKLAIFFEPNFGQISSTFANLQYNKKNVIIIDIEQTRDIEFCVKWAFPKAWAAMCSLVDQANTVNTETSLSNLFTCCNGAIGVVPFTNLVSPDGSSVTINMYVSSDNMMFNEPAEDQLPVIMFPPISTEAIDFTTEASDYKDPTQIRATCLDLNPTNAHATGISEYHFGEMPVSWRALFNRFFLTGNVGLVTSVGQFVTAIGQVVPATYPTPDVNVPSGYKPTIFNYVRMAFMAMTGGLRKRVRILGVDNNTNNTTHVSLEHPRNATTANSLIVSTLIANNVPYFEGTTTFVNHVNSGIEFEIPFYTNNLFVLSNNDDPYNPTDPVMEQFCLRNYVVSTDAAATGTLVTFLEETAAAEDFRLVRFVAPAPLYF